MHPSGRPNDIDAFSHYRDMILRLQCSFDIPFCKRSLCFTETQVNTSSQELCCPLLLPWYLYYLPDPELFRDQGCIQNLLPHFSSVGHSGIRVEEFIVKQLGVREVEFGHLQELDAGRQVGLVEFVGDIPANGAKLAPFLHQAVHVAHDEQQLPPVLPIHCVQEILQTCRRILSKGI